MSVHRGRTDNVKSVFVGADWWEQGKKLAGVVVDVFDTPNGRAYAVKLLKAQVVKGESHEIVGIGGLKGFGMALADAGLGELRFGDKLVALCTGKRETDKGAPMVEFEVEVTRED